MTDTPTTPTSAPGSILGRMKQARQEIVDHLHTSIKVPHWDDVLPDGTRLPEVYLRYRAVDLEFLSGNQQKIEKAKPADRGRVEMEVNLDVLAQAAVGAFAVIDGECYSLDGTDTALGSFEDIDKLPDEALTPIGPEFAVQIGAANTLDDGRHTSSRRVLRTLFFHDGDIVYHGNRIGRFSGYRDSAADDEFRGNS